MYFPRPKDTNVSVLLGVLRGDSARHVVGYRLRVTYVRGPSIVKVNTMVSGLDLKNLEGSPPSACKSLRFCND